MNNKIVPLEKLAEFGGVLCHGCFDGIHFGHIKYLQWASKLAWGRVIVTLTADEFFPDKGVGRPAFPQQVRAEWLASQETVKYVAIVNNWSAVASIVTIRPVIYARGQEDYPMPAVEMAAMESVGTKAVYIPKERDSAGRVYSSSHILSGEYLKSRPRGIGEGDVGVE